MTGKELAEILLLPGNADRIVVLSADAEGNAYSALSTEYGVSVGKFHSDEGEMYEDSDRGEKLQKAIFLYPED